MDLNCIQLFYLYKVFKQNAKKTYYVKNDMFKNPYEKV